ncbi:hypothetical protein Hdeb2414_s0507g00907151 [Helianthus debilis subsp. tardiflorus]
MAQAPPSRPWFRLATMRAPPPAPAPTPTPAPAPGAQPSQGPPPLRPPIIRPTFTQTTPPPQPTPTPTPTPPPPQQPTPTPPPPPQQPTPAPTPTQQPIPTPSLPRPTLTPARAINVVEPPTQPTPPPSSSPSGAVIGRTPPPLLRTATTTPVPSRAVSPPSSPPKTIKPLEQTPPRASSPPPRSLSPPKRTQLILSPPSSPPRAPLNQNTTLPEATSTMRPLSPLQLPSLKQKPYDEGTQEYTQKTMLVQETKEKPKTSATGFNARHIGGFHTHNNNATRKPETLKKHMDSEDAGKNIITIAGENKGAIMNITPFGDKKQDFGKNIHFNRNNPPNTLNNDGETDSDAKNKNENSNSPLKTSFLNSNVQGVNNSILFNCSINHHDPGIHLTLSTKADRDLDTGNHSKRALL